MGALLWLAATFVVSGSAHRLTQAVILFALIGAGIAAYGALLAAFKVTGVRELVDAIRPPRDLRP